MITRALATSLVLSLAAALAACAAKPFDYHSQNEIVKGPGVFTGETGAAVVRIPGTGGGSSRGGAPTPRAVAAVAGSASNAVPTGAQDFHEFEAFREFRRAKSEGSPDYNEFQEWLEWKAYRDKVRPKDSKSR